MPVHLLRTRTVDVCQFTLVTLEQWMYAMFNHSVTEQWMYASSDIAQEGMLVTNNQDLKVST